MVWISYSNGSRSAEAGDASVTDDRVVDARGDVVVVLGLEFGQNARAGQGSSPSNSWDSSSAHRVASDGLSLP